MARMTKGTLISMALAAGLAAMLVWQLSDSAKLRQENKALSQQIAQLNQGPTNGEQNGLAETNTTPGLTADEQRELLRLRGEVVLMKQKVVS